MGAFAPFLSNGGWKNLTLQFFAVIAFTIFLNFFIFASNTAIKKVGFFIKNFLSKVKTRSPTYYTPLFTPLIPYNYAMAVFFSFAVAGNDFTIWANYSMFVHVNFLLKDPYDLLGHGRSISQLMSKSTIIL